MTLCRYANAVSPLVAGALALTLLAGSAGAATATDDTGSERVQRVTVIVNDQPISTWDLEQRTLLTIFSSGAPNKPEIRERIRAQVLRSLVDEQLQVQEAQRNDIKVSRDEIVAAMTRIARQNNMDLSQIGNLLDANGISLKALETQIEAELAWQKLITQRLAPRIQIDPADVDDALRRAEESARKVQYLVAEIFIAVDSPTEEDQSRTSAQAVLTQIRSGAPFPSVAQQFSESASAAAGGDLGWVTEGQLPVEVDAVLQGMRPNQISDPIRAAGGFYIIAVRDQRVPAGTHVSSAPVSSLPPGKVQLAQVIVPRQGRGEDGIKAAATIATAMARRVSSCRDARALTGEVQGADYSNLGVLNRGDLAPALRGVLANLPTGGASPVFQTDSGAGFLVVCEGGVAPKIQEVEMPTREDVENRLYAQQLSVLARRYLRDLRRDAVVENR